MSDDDLIYTLREAVEALLAHPSAVTIDDATIARRMAVEFLGKGAKKDLGAESAMLAGVEVALRDEGRQHDDATVRRVYDGMSMERRVAVLAHVLEEIIVAIRAEKIARAQRAIREDGENRG